MINIEIRAKIKWAGQLVSVGFMVNNFLDKVYFNHLSRLKADDI